MTTDDLVTLEADVAWCAANPWSAASEIKRLRAVLEAIVAERAGREGRRIAAVALRVRSPAYAALHESAKPAYRTEP